MELNEYVVTYCCGDDGEDDGDGGDNVEVEVWGGEGIEW